ncbi:MAG: asparagine synthase (glutamine-hydrolyzing) [Actinobacteria bacterium]|nr:asparagine synthase (glutamine-hydrolyzing) [Actinomycetota bacterium]
MLAFGEASAWASRLEEWSARIQHRGPDAEGTWHDDDLALTHRRLSIIDPTSSSDQPLASPDGRFVLAFNGEIYNFRALAPGARGDTQALLQGRPLATSPELLRGMFAYALWDRAARELWLVRDRYGMKPLYVAERPDHVVFGSSARIVGAIARLEEIDTQALAQYLRYGSVWSKGTLIKGVEEVDPGSVKRCGRGLQSRVRRYWNLSSQLICNSASDGNSLEDAFRQSVSAHLVSDVPVGLFLSGGVDSTLLALIAKESTQDLTAVTLGFKDLHIDESGLARSTAAAYGLRHTVVAGEDIDTQHLDHFLVAGDLPSIDGFNTYLVSRAASQQSLKVALTGLGADEILGGYSKHWLVPALTALARLGRPLTHPVLRALGGPSDKAREIATHRQSLVATYGVLRSVFTIEDVRQLAGRDPHPPVGVSDELPLHFRLASLEIENYLRFTLLRDADTYSMIHSLELRMPFVDHVFHRHLREQSPLELMLRRKRVLTARFNDQLLRDRARRRKTGFRIPYRDYLRGPLSSHVRQLDKGPLNGLLDVDGVSEVVNRWRAGMLNSVNIWGLVCLDSWVRSYRSLLSNGKTVKDG